MCCRPLTATLTTDYLQPQHVAKRQTKVNMFAQEGNTSRSGVYQRKRERPIQPDIHRRTMNEDGDHDLTMLLTSVSLPHSLLLSPSYFCTTSQCFHTKSIEALWNGCLEISWKSNDKKISIGVDNVAANVFIAMPGMESHYHCTTEFPYQL